ncbi:MFS transporter [Actinoallomurus iriomotensis]|uniref:MFS transporter n=2 Tax=Actinoallomurus iriomotensis TaxID=478107 RepID=A0A9W6S563_9ACTN|nr:MFS transporter [Actinoallomurus iriomotensis]
MDMAAPLASRPYRAFLAAELISSAGGAVAPIALAFSILQIGGRGSGIAVVLGGEFVVYLVLLPVTGVIADRAAGVGVLVVSQAIAAAFQMAEALLIISGTARVWSLALVAGGGAGAAALFTPAGRRVLPALVPAGQLDRANALSQAGKHGLATIGPVAGGILVTTVGPGWGIAWDSVTFVVAAVLFSRLPRPPALPDHHRRRWDRRWAGELADGVRALTGRTWLWTTTLADCLAGGAFAAAMLIGPLYARQYLHGAISWGAIAGGLAAGSALGSIMATAWTMRRPGIVISVGSAAMCVGLAAMATGMPLPLIMAGTLVAGIAFGPAAVARATVVQQHVPGHQLGRVSAYQEFAASVPIPIAYALAGVTADRLGARIVIGACAAIIAVAALTPLAVRDVRRLAFAGVDR